MPKVRKEEKKQPKAKKTTVKAEVKARRAEAKPAKKAPTRSAKKKADTGSVYFQIKNFSAKIAALTEHLKEHKHDFDSRRGLLIMVGKRRRLLNYVKKNDPERYDKLIESLKLKKVIE